MMGVRLLYGIFVQPEIVTASPTLNGNAAPVVVMLFAAAFSSAYVPFPNFSPAAA